MTANSFNQEHNRALNSVLQPKSESSICASLQVSLGNEKCPEASMSGQYPRAQTQDGQSIDPFRNPRKRTYSHRGGSQDGEDGVTINRKKTRPVNTFVAKNLACPFYRNDPKNHGKHRSCAGQGWISIHHVKEHILRQHALPIHCPRCLQTFNTETECNLHLRQAALCPLSDSTPPEGFNKEQEAALRTRRRGNTEREWRAIYKLLFPNVPEDLIPSPYYEDDEMHLELLQRRESIRFQRHMELAVPRSVLRLLEQTTFETSVSLDVPMRTQLVEIVASAVAEASQSYRRESPPIEAQAPAVLNEPSTFSHQPQSPGAPGSMLYLPTSTPMHGPLQPQANAQQQGVLEHWLGHSTGVHDGMEHQENDSRSGNGLLVDPWILDMSLFDWSPDQDTSFQGP